MPRSEEVDFRELCHEMVAVIDAYARLNSERLGRDRIDPRVLDAMRRVPRHEFVPRAVVPLAYADTPLPIGYGKTISQPFIVALMTDLLELDPRHRVLEVGTGLGYQAAVLAELANRVWSVEIVAELAAEGERRLAASGYEGVTCRLGDGAQGWPEEAPFDRIIVTAAPELIPTALLRQLRPGGRMIIPAGLEGHQQLLLVEKDEAGRTHTREVLAVSFTPLVVSH
jgi:protein-L-isoaspartate(D-aspartate) O-methyltransferase